MDDAANTIMERAGAAVAAGRRGERAEARAIFDELWDQVGSDDGDPVQRCAVAHWMADVQDDVQSELLWDLRALEAMARSAGVSPYHFLRTFERLTGVTPHQYVLRARLREAALRVVAEPDRILDIALDCGFGDVSNFNRAFKTEFGVAPRTFRRTRSRSADL